MIWNIKGRWNIGILEYWSGKKYFLVFLSISSIIPVFHHSGFLEGVL